MPSTEPARKTPESWRDLAEVDPAAVELPMTPDDEIDVRAHDIIENGLR